MKQKLNWSYLNKGTRSINDENIAVIELYLASFTSIKQAVLEINQRYEKIDVLINNAGLCGSEDRKMTDDGNELHFQTNHLGCTRNHYQNITFPNLECFHALWWTNAG